MYPGERIRIKEKVIAFDLFLTKLSTMEITARRMICVVAIYTQRDTPLDIIKLLSM